MFLIRGILPTFNNVRYELNLAAMIKMRLWFTVVGALADPGAPQARVTALEGVVASSTIVTALCRAERSGKICSDES